MDTEIRNAVWFKGSGKVHLFVCTPRYREVHTIADRSRVNIEKLKESLSWDLGIMAIKPDPSAPAHRFIISRLAG